MFHLISFSIMYVCMIQTAIYVGEARFSVSGPYKYGSKGNATRVQVGSVVILLCHDAVQLIADPEEFKRPKSSNIFLARVNSESGHGRNAGRMQTTRL